ncbi:MAG: hypothetical protein LBI62_00305 [Candidatus Accumulibacter sp.]|nr:hypothetical protein [Accumulibacter sp.]
MLLDAVALLVGAMNEMAALPYVQVAEAKTHVKTSYVAGMCQVMEMQGYPFEEKYQN